MSKALKSQLLQISFSFLKKAKLRLFLFYFVSFHIAKAKYSTNLAITDKSIDGGLGSQTMVGSMEGADNMAAPHKMHTLFISRSMFAIAYIYDVGKVV